MSLSVARFLPKELKQPLLGLYISICRAIQSSEQSLGKSHGLEVIRQHAHRLPFRRGSSLSPARCCHPGSTSSIHSYLLLATLKHRIILFMCPTGFVRQPVFRHQHPGHRAEDNLLQCRQLQFRRPSSSLLFLHFSQWNEQFIDHKPCNLFMQCESWVSLRFHDTNQQLTKSLA